MATAAFVSEARASGALGTDPVVNKPAGAATGDFLVAMCSGGASPTITPPSDTNPWLTAESSTTGIRLFYKFLAASDSGITTFTFAFSGAGNAVANIVCFSGVNTSTPFDGTPGVVFTTTTGNIVIPGITTTATRYCFSMVQKIVAAGQSFSPLSGQTEKYDAVTVNNFGTAGGEEASVSVASAANTRTWDPSNTASGLVGGYFFALVNATTAYTKALTAVMDGTPTIVNKVKKTLTAVMNGIPTLGRDITAHRVLTAVMDGTPTIVYKVGSRLTAVMDGTASLSVKVRTTLSAVMNGVGSLLRKVGKFLTAVMDGTPTLDRGVTASRTLEVVMDGTTTLTSRQTLLRQLAAVMDGTGSLSTQSVLARVLSAVMNGIGRGFVEFPWDSIPSDCPPDWSPNDGLKCVAGDVLFHEPPHEGEPVVGATVCLIRDDDGLRVECVLTDASGHYSFPRDTNDPYTYHVEVTYDDGGVKQQGLSEGGCAPVVCS